MTLSEALRELEEQERGGARRGSLPVIPSATYLALIEVARAAERASTEIQAQKVSWPGEVDTLADRLADLRQALGCEP